MKSSRIVKHLLLAGLVLPVSLAGYHVMAESGLKEPVTEALPFGLGDLSIGAEYSLPRLALLERDLYRVESRYCLLYTSDAADEV